MTDAIIDAIAVGSISLEDAFLNPSSGPTSVLLTKDEAALWDAVWGAILDKSRSLGETVGDAETMIDHTARGAQAGILKVRPLAMRMARTVLAAFKDAEIARIEDEYHAGLTSNFEAA